MGSSTAGRKLFRRPGGRHVLVTVLVAVAVLAYLVLLPSDEVAPVPGSPCRADGPARTDPLLAPDLDGDGFGELVYEDAREPDGFQVVVVPGSARGPDAARATVLDRDDLGVPDSVQSIDDTWRPTVADLDGDGHLDLVVSGAAQVVWGGPDGPRADGPHGRVPLPGGPYADAPVAGDVDGDGHLDLVAYRFTAENPGLVVLKGPFERSGAPADTVEIPTPVNKAASPALLLGDADGDRAADLAVYDSPWDPPLLLTGGADTPSGLSDKPQRLPAGESVAFGDFDGDGRRDIAVGQSFVDPYDEEETPYRRGQVRIAYGKEPGTWVTVEGGAPQEGFGTRLGAGDFDGDGCDDLAVQLTRKKEAADARFAVLHGGSDHGLASEPWRTVRRTVAEPSAPVDEGPVDGSLFAAADWDGDGHAELALAGGGHWWFTDGTDRDTASFPEPGRGDTR
ncbi:FG-GAP and VCBS repeat-containing protein [Streptomyces albidoflavus]|uniref:FG-GAP and VCBS repeat-containing protein n=1 Tax=Streptomyces albidoflavus TaxID=1886 RepID=UPI00340A9818